MLINQGNDHLSLTGSLTSSIGWVENLLVGPLGTTLAIIAVAGIGFGMLQGRVAPRQSIRVILGCFILFSAPVLAASFLDFVRWTSGPQTISVGTSQPPASSPPIRPPINPDPYAGAALPR